MMYMGMTEDNFKILYAFCRKYRIELRYNFPAEYFKSISKSPRYIGSYQVNMQIGFIENMRLVRRLVNDGEESFDPLIEEIPPLGPFLQLHTSNVYGWISGEKTTSTGENISTLKDQQEKETRKAEQSFLSSKETNQAKLRTIKNKLCSLSDSKQKELITLEDEILTKQLQSMDEIIEEEKQMHYEPQAPSLVQLPVRLEKLPERTDRRTVKETAWGTYHARERDTLEEQKLLPRLPGETLKEYKSRYSAWSVEQIRHLLKDLQKKQNP